MLFSSNFYRIEHLLGRPQGPSDFSLTSGRTFAGPLFAVLVPSSFGCVFCTPISSFAPSPFSSVAPLDGPYSHAKLTLLTAFPNDSPCIVAISNSNALGMRDPSLPYQLLFSHLSVYHAETLLGTYSESSSTPW